MEYCRGIGETKRAAYSDQDYWARPVPNFGDPNAQALIVGLAPGAHGSNRTGRMFTGDRSGQWLFRVLHEAGSANQPTWEDPSDGLELRNMMITAMGHCAPPGNKPTPDELRNCHDHLSDTFDLLRGLLVVIALGKVAYDGCGREFRRRGWVESLPAFSHGVELDTRGPILLGSYHPSQQNTFTGKLTEPMLRSVFERAATICRARE